MNEEHGGVMVISYWLESYDSMLLAYWREGAF